MNAGAGLLDLVYVGVMLGSGVLLAILWRMLPGLLREEVTRADIPIEPPLWSARASNTRADVVLPQP